ncbi:class I SAM-dependent methyltransferase [Thermomonas carbonis]|uniref:Class I SAM-dependent methyltransferase n=1 Tax=Thermomonas carbonis TaxID=1463158 RepID=A0A7G9SS29_9GAMM|nr:class I SAM-dependent methyltransferase [Thermomonas carbonis]QNN70654.1 class I SAM-dependent methyltransferase [Thermomonas carbonis]GHC01472.1 16S rRNA methyltransferase [Thermomonas carbonis]
MSNHRDIALDALLYPFAEGALRWSADALFLRAREGAALHMRGGLQSLACTQPFKPEADRLQRIGATLVDEDAVPAARYPLVLVLPPRQREEARALLAKACMAVAPGGIVIASVANDEGAKSREADLKQLAGTVTTLSKHHCRVSWTRPDATFDAATLAQWAKADAPRKVISPNVPGEAFLSRPGVFAWDRVDAASAMLAEALPNDLSGRIADFGAGWGYLSMQVLARCPKVASLDLYEADARALALAGENLADSRVPVSRHWRDVAAGVSERFDAIVCNPPFHALGRGDRPDIGRAFIAAAASALKPGGRLWLVANRHLPYEYALGEGFAQVQTLAQDGGFKIVEATKAAR